MANKSAPASKTQLQSPKAQAVAASVGVSEPENELFNEDAAAARHLTAIRIRGQIADFDGEQPAA
ncbi:hypothetical protein PQR62_17635 [Herbaspirillum lusitanum]|uniref:Uncharacterized protein n=1 Tax=Herbaspirillum lusitanum TaxID=213312 RepID=A0ABW9AFB7_9BURK